jgi:tetratricopeptide (TPR) repeat protein
MSAPYSSAESVAAKRTGRRKSHRGFVRQWLAGAPALILCAAGAHPTLTVAQTPEGQRQASAETTKADALLQSAQQALKAGKSAAAVADLERAAQTAPHDPRPYQRLGAIFRQAGYLDREIDALENALRRAPSDADSALRLAEIYIDLVWFDKGRQKVVQAELARPNDPRLFVLLATQAYMRFQYPQMERAAVEGLKRWPKDIVLITLLSEANRLQGRLPEAEGLLKQIQTIATEPRAKTANWTGLARLLLSDKWKTPRYAEAERAARAALQITPGDVDAHYWLGRALQLQGRSKEAIAQYETVLRQDPQLEQVAFFLGGLYLRAGDKAKQAEGERLLAAYRRQIAQEERYRDARDAVWQHPERPDTHLKMGQEYLSTGQLPQAVVELRQALRMRPNDPRARKLLIQALERSGRLTEAKQLGKER